MNHEAIKRQALTLAVCYDLVLAAVQSIGTVNTADQDKISLIVQEAIKNAAQKAGCPTA